MTEPAYQSPEVNQLRTECVIPVVVLSSVV